jgi:L-rhamnose-H+ transport protein
MAILTGFLWYGQFFFYGLGHVRMGKYDFSSWAIHMIMLVLLSAVTGLVLKEWSNSSKKTIRLLIVTILILIAAVLLLTEANRLGNAV